MPGGTAQAEPPRDREVGAYSERVGAGEQPGVPCVQGHLGAGGYEDREARQPGPNPDVLQAKAGAEESKLTHTTKTVWK